MAKVAKRASRNATSRNRYGRASGARKAFALRAIRAPVNGMGLRALAVGMVASLLLACGKRAESTTRADAGILRDPARANALASVRSADEIANEDLGHADVAVRRAAVRALSRLEDPGAVPKLLSALSDEDAEVVAFVAHGLGWACEAHPSQATRITKALVARAISLAGRSSSPFDPAYAISHALSRCATKQAEPTLAAFLERPAPWPQGAALALGLFASQRGTLSKATQTALLDAAETQSLDEALFALGRIEVAKELRPRLVEVARSHLEKEGPGRLFALRALGRAGAEGARVLAELVKEDLAPAEQAEIVRALVRLGAEGQRALRDFVKAALPGDEVEQLGTALFGPLLVAVEGLGTTWGRETLQAVARKRVPAEATPALARRLDLLRCAAAKRIAGSSDPLLEGCDAPRVAQGATQPAAATVPGDAASPQGPVKLRFETDAGAMTLTLDPTLAPQSVARIVDLAKGGYFDGTPVAHAIPGFFVRLGGAKEGVTRPEPPPRETAPVPFDAFTVGLAHEGDEIFVTLARLPELDGHYAWLGKADAAFAALAPGDVVQRVVVE